MLLAGALGVSNLICLMNNGARGTRPTQANNLGPFYRAAIPRCADGDSIVRSPTAGSPLVFHGLVKDEQGAPISGADVHVCQSSPAGLYENQNATHAEMNLRVFFATHT